MTREEEILNAARERAGRHQIAERELNKYSSQLYDGIYSSEIASFEAGAKWADEHPKNVWHSADEQPVGEDWKILLEDKNGMHWVTSRCSVSVFYGNWQKFTEDDALTRWAYVSDLLPKGGE